MNVASVNKQVVHDGKIVKSIMCFACGKPGQASTLRYVEKKVNLVKVQVL